MSDNHLQIITIQRTSQFPQLMALFAGRDFPEADNLVTWYHQKTGRLVDKVYRYVRPSSQQILWAIDIGNGNGT